MIAPSPLFFDAKMHLPRSVSLIDDTSTELIGDELLQNRDVFDSTSEDEGSDNFSRSRLARKVAFFLGFHLAVLFSGLLPPDHIIPRVGWESKTPRKAS